jgi:hypothetical protein
VPLLHGNRLLNQLFGEAMRPPAPTRIAAGVCASRHNKVALSMR